MKHIKRKFIRSYNLKDDAYDYINNNLSTEEAKDVNSKYFPMLITSNKEIVQGFFIKLMVMTL